MTELFGIDFAAEIDDALGDDLISATLVKTTYGDRISGPTGGRSKEELAYTTTGVVTGYSESLIDGKLIQAGDRQIRLIANRLPVDVEPGDNVEIGGRNYKAIAVRTDAGEAVWVIQGRRL